MQSMTSLPTCRWPISALNLSLILKHHPVQMPDNLTEKIGVVSICAWPDLVITDCCVFMERTGCLFYGLSEENFVIKGRKSFFSSCHATSVDLSDPLPSPFSICCIPLYVVSSWSSCLCLSMWRGPQEYVTWVCPYFSSSVPHIWFI